MTGLLGVVTDIIAPVPAEAAHMIAGSALFKPNEITVHVGTYSKGKRGGAVPSYADAGTQYDAYVEAQPTLVVRDPGDGTGMPVGRKVYWVFTPTDPGAIVDSHIVWHARTLGALGRSQDLSGEGVLWLTECSEVL